MKGRRKFCSACGSPIARAIMDGVERDRCPACGLVFYDNPLPVVSAVVPRDREILLVLRDREPSAGMWCLPSGFVELDESIEEAVLRETREESGIEGEVVRLLDAGSGPNEFYGDLVWMSFEVNAVGGSVAAGDDARDARYFPVGDLPKLAFESNERAVLKYIEYYRDIWAMRDSFGRIGRGEGEMLSDKLFGIISTHAGAITQSWLDDVRSNPSTAKYAKLPADRIFRDAHFVISRFGDWISNRGAGDERMREHFRAMGRKAREAGVPLSEIMSALSLARKHIFADVFGRHEILDRTIEQYRILEMTTRVNLFFDRAAYYMARGYEEGQTG